MKVRDLPNLTVRVPAALVKKLDASAKKAHRSRSSEIRARLEASLREEVKGVKTVESSDS